MPKRLDLSGKTFHARNSVFIQAFGQTKTLAEWAESLGVDRRKIHKRLKLGWSAEKALTIA